MFTRKVVQIKFQDYRDQRFENPSLVIKWDTENLEDAYHIAKTSLIINHGGFVIFVYDDKTEQHLDMDVAVKILHNEMQQYHMDIQIKKENIDTPNE